MACRVHYPRNKITQDLLSKLLILL